MSFVSNGGKFKLYIVPNGLRFSRPTQPRFSFERMIDEDHKDIEIEFIFNLDLIYFLGYKLWLLRNKSEK
jgi:hypothetical protein